MKYYKCFSFNLKKFIGVHNIKPVSSGVHPETKKTYFVYELDDNLSEVLKRWTDNKK